MDVMEKLNSLKNVFISIQNIISNPIMSIIEMYPLHKLENAWEHHQDDSCPCQFYDAMPVSWQTYSNADYKMKAQFINKIRENLKQQHLDQYTFQQSKINEAIKKYKPIFPWLWSDHWDYDRILHPDILQIFDDPENGKKLFLEQLIKPEIEDRVFSFPFLCDQFCDQLVAELANYEA